MEREVKPCPFCGRQPRVSANDAHNGRLYCDCINDDGTVGPKTWNTRFVEPKDGMDREALDIKQVEDIVVRFSLDSEKHKMTKIRPYDIAEKICERFGQPKAGIDKKNLMRIMRGNIRKVMDGSYFKIRGYEKAADAIISAIQKGEL